MGHENFHCRVALVVFEEIIVRMHKLNKLPCPFGEDRYVLLREDYTLAEIVPTVEELVRDDIPRQSGPLARFATEGRLERCNLEVCMPECETLSHVGGDVVPNSFLWISLNAMGPGITRRDHK